MILPRRLQEDLDADGMNHNWVRFPHFSSFCSFNFDAAVSISPPWELHPSFRLCPRWLRVGIRNSLKLIVFKPLMVFPNNVSGVSQGKNKKSSKLRTR